MESYNRALQDRIEPQDQIERRATSAVLIDEAVSAIVDRPTAARQDASASHELGRRLRSLAGEVDDLWRSSLQGQDFDLVWRSSEASHALHRAVLALEDDVTIG